MVSGAGVVLEGERSDACPVLSGVPLLGPCLFLLYIIDMPGNIQSSIRLFVDDINYVSNYFEAVRLPALAKRLIKN